MRHNMAGRKLGRKSSHRKALFMNLATSLLEHEQIKTTVPKAKDLRRFIEPLITKARKGDLAARREVSKVIKNETILKKLFDNIAPRFKDTPGGYTRVLKAGFRQGDAAPMAVIELTALEGETGKKAAAPKKKATAKSEKPVKKEAAKAEEKPAKAVQAEACAVSAEEPVACEVPAKEDKKDDAKTE